MKSRLFKTAWSISSKYASFSDALKAAWKVIKLATKMKQGVVNFAFKKVDGSLREAVGTLKNIPAVKGDRKPNLALFTYFDL